MAYLEELLPEFRKGAKIRKNDWDKHQYIYYKDNNIYTHKNMCINLIGDELLAGYWELYHDPEPDWQYIIDHKCLCWFWNGDDRNKGVIDYLVTVSNESYELYENTSGCRWSHCCPVRKDEVTFYEDREDEN